MNILVIRLSSLGDVVLATPVLAGLRAALPQARLAFLTKGAFAPVLNGNPHLDETLVFESRGLLGWAAEIRRRRFDAVIDLHDTPRSRIWSLFSGAPRRVRYDKRAWERRRLVWKKQPSPRLSGGTVDRYLETLEALGLPVVENPPRLYLKAGETLSPSLAARLGAGPFIALAPGAQHATKRWPAERFAAAADLLAGGGRVVLLGAAADRDAAEAVRRALKSPSESFAGQTSLREMMAILSRARLLLTNDSGAMHVGAALGVPTAAVFGPTVKEFGFFPRGEKTAVVENAGLHCRPCSLHGTDRCPEGHFRCMKEISPESVADAARSLLAGASR